MRALFCVAALVSACTTGAERADLDTDVGSAIEPPIAVRAALGNAQVRELTVNAVTVWSQAPEISLEIENSGAAVAAFRVVVLNALPTTEFIGPPTALELERPRPTERELEFALPAESTLTISLVSPPGATRRFRVAIMGDIQTALDRVDGVFDAINDTGDLEFVLSTGDIVEHAKDEEFDLFDEKLAGLRIPFYSTIGNHELRRDPENWHRRYGRFSIYFVHRGVAFSFVDSGNASLHPEVYDRLDDALDANRDRLHLVGTHYPPIDPVGARSGSFRSRKEASKFLARLADGAVDATFYGHIHSYYAFSNAGIPAFISGGGGALAELWDGVGRHFLVATVDADREDVEVALVRVD